MTPRRLLRLDLPRGERVVEVLPALAAALAGNGPALLPVDPADPRADAIVAVLGADSPGPGMTAAARRLDGWEDDPADPTALVMPTSGSTGAPKGVLLSAGQLAASAAATEARLGDPGSWLLALPAQHIAGMQVLLRAARAGTAVVALDDEKPFTAADFARRAAALPGPRRYVSLVPTQLRRILADAEATAATAGTFDAVLVGGSAIDPLLLTAARAAGIRAVTTYGMTETCGGCVYDGVPLDGVSVRLTEGGALAITGPMVARGYRGQPGHPAFSAPASGGRTRIGPDGLAAASRAEHRLNGPGRTAETAAAVPDDILRRRQGTGTERTPATGTTAAIPGSAPASATSGTGAAGADTAAAAPGSTRTFITSDFGAVGDDGRVTVLGRLDDLIVTGGVKVPPAAVESAIRMLPGVADVLVVGVPSAEWGAEVAALVVPGADGERWDTAALRRALAAAGSLPAAHRPHRVIAVPAIPLLPSGKPDRAAGRALADPAD